MAHTKASLEHINLDVYRLLPARRQESLFILRVQVYKRFDVLLHSLRYYTSHSISDLPPLLLTFIPRCVCVCVSVHQLVTQILHVSTKRTYNFFLEGIGFFIDRDSI